MLIDDYNFNSPSDIACTVSRALITSYSKDATIPIAFRHYSNDYIGDGEFGSKHGRNHCNIFIYLEGDFGFITEKCVYNMSYGDIFVSRDREPFWSKCTSITRMDYYQFDIPCVFFDMIPEAEFFRRIFFNRDAGRHNHISMPISKKKSCIDKLKRIEEIIRSTNPSHSLIYSYFVQIIGMLNDSFNFSDNPDLSYDAPQCVIKALQYIKSNYITIESIDEITGIVGVSASYLCRTFKKAMGCTVNSYIQFLRISHAKYLLENGRDVTDACFESGFNSYSYFIQVFKGGVGMTPNKYRNNIL